MAVRVVIAEDEFLIATQTRHELERQGYEVVAVARTGTEALDLCILHRPEVVLMDIRMPDMGGIEATRRIMSICPACVVVVTGNPDLGQEAERAGAMGYVVKPFHSEQVRSAIEAARARFAELMGERRNGESSADEPFDSAQGGRR